MNQSVYAHPMHVHLVAFQVLDRQNFVVVNGITVPSGPRVPPPASEAGWKDTVMATPNQITRVIMKFEGFHGLYPMHCHILEHEDNEMMRQFRVLCPSDTNGDDVTNSADLSVLLGQFGSPVPRGSNGDLNSDGVVNGADLSLLLANFGQGCV